MIAPRTTAALVGSLLADADQMPQSARDAAQRLLLDVIGVAIAGAATEEGQIIARAAAKNEAPGPCGMPIHGNRHSPAVAAMVTGTMAYSIGLTDTHALSITHPGSSIAPAALAVGEAAGSTPDEILTAIALGVDLVARIGSAANPSHRRRGFHPTATCNHFGAALAASRLLHLSPGQTLSALGIAGSMAGGLYEFRQEGSMLMAFHGGWPAHGGVTAAYLAAEGFTGPHTILEGPEGFLAAFADQTRPEWLERPPGSPWLVEDVSLRPYCACRYAHSAIDALELINRRRHTAPDEIERLTVWTHLTAIEQETEPTTVVSARLSTKFNIALAAAYGPRLSEVTAADLVDPVLRRLMDRIELREDAELTAIFPEKWASRVDLIRRDGSADHARVDVAKGDPANPLSEEEVAAKFRRLVTNALGVDRTSTLLDALTRRPPQLNGLWRLTRRPDGAEPDASAADAATAAGLAK